MRVSRLMFWGSVGLSAMALLLALATTGCGNGGTPKGVTPHNTVNLSCTKSIKVDPGDKYGVDQHQRAVYICNGDTLKWDNPSSATFTVHFPDDCPFSPCPDISDSQPRTIKPLPTDLTVYKYVITVNSVTRPDPHVVGGGS
jgi:hypothetical protein